MSPVWGVAVGLCELLRKGSSMVECFILLQEEKADCVCVQVFWMSEDCPYCLEKNDPLYCSCLDLCSNELYTAPLAV